MPCPHNVFYLVNRMVRYAMPILRCNRGCWRLGHTSQKSIGRLLAGFVIE
ncbi:MAG: hypothetical protein ISS33_02135 [Candidatus Omnitrophica bacterium]|nr:hypothetical protein [Candidatus Omnitrophota bacterium]